MPPAEQLGQRLLADPINQQVVVSAVGDELSSALQPEGRRVIEVQKKPV